MPEAIKYLFISHAILMLLGGISFLYQHIYATDPNIRKSDEYKKAVEKDPDIFPEGNIYSPGTGIVLARLAWLLYKKQNKSARDKRYIFFTILCNIAAVLMLINLLVGFNIDIKPNN